MKFQYIISATVRRCHLNPPHTDYHYHDFIVRLHFEAEQNGLYGIDMVWAEQQLNRWLATLPDPINRHPMLENGTTEEFCKLIRSEFSFTHPFLRIEVGETPERITVLCCQ